MFYCLGFLNDKAFKSKSLFPSSLKFYHYICVCLSVCLPPPLSEKALTALEAKHSLLRSELVAMKEVLEKSRLDGELMTQEKHELAMALERVRVHLLFPGSVKPSL